MSNKFSYLLYVKAFGFSVEFGDITCVIVGGNFTVLGNTQNVQVDTLNIEDNIILIGSGSSDISSVIDTGIAFERGQDTSQYKYATFFFDESANRFALGLTGDTAGAVITGSTAGDPSLIASPAYVMSVVQTGNDTAPTIQPSASLESATDFGVKDTVGTQVGQVKINNDGTIWIYS